MDRFPRRLKCYYQKRELCWVSQKINNILREGGSKGEFQAEAVKIKENLRCFRGPQGMLRTQGPTSELAT